jgi:hypothetical protein
MKKNIIILAAATLAISLNAQSPDVETNFKEVNPPNFLVHNQLSPEIIKLEYAAGLTKGSFKNKEGQVVNRFHENSFTFSGYPVTLLNKRQQQLYLGFGYVRDWNTAFDNNHETTTLESKREAVYLNIFFNTRIKKRFYWFSYLQGGLNGTDPYKDTDRTFNLIALNKINYKVKRNMNIGVGVTYVSNLGNPILLPAIAFVYSQGHYLVNIDFPVKAEVEGILAYGKWRPVVGVSFPAGTHYIRNSDQYLSTTGMLGYVGMRYRVFDLLYLYAAYQTGLGETYSSGTRSVRPEFGTYAGQSRFIMSFNIQVARFIPLTQQ